MCEEKEKGKRERIGVREKTREKRGGDGGINHDAMCRANND